MTIGVGLDLCEIGRMEKLVAQDSFLARFFTEEERTYIRSRGKGAAASMAGIFAAKEAFAKALGTGITFDLKEAEVTHGETGTPEYRLSGRAAELGKGSRFFLSISHDGGMAGAVCVRDDGR